MTTTVTAPAPPRPLVPPLFPAPGSIPAGTTEEAAILARASQGDAAAFAVLYGWYARALYHHCYRWLEHRADAEDAVQDTFARAWVALPAAWGASQARGEPLRLGGWLYRIATNQCIDRRRRRSTRVTWVPWAEVTGLEEGAGSGLDADACNAFGDCRPTHPALVSHAGEADPEGWVVARELAEAVQAALAELPQRQRQALRLWVFGAGETSEAGEASEGGQVASYAAVAEAMGTTVPAIKAYLFRARRVIRAQAVGAQAVGAQAALAATDATGGERA